MVSIINKLGSQFKGKKVLIVGLGLQGGGVGLAKFFANLGAKVTVTDKKTKEQLLQSINKLARRSFSEGGLNDYKIEYTVGEHKLADFLQADVIFKAPKMRWDDPLIVAAQKKGVRIEMETSFFASLCPAPIIGITGTRGKSTTTMMIYEILKKYSSRTAHLAGNIPQTSTVNLLPAINKEDYVVAELSSWQLSAFHRKKISPHISVFTNFYPDHYDYYKSEAEYLYDKKAIYLYQKKDDYLIINKHLKKLIVQDKPKSKIAYFDSSDFPNNLVHLRGVHNLENAAAALGVSRIFDLDPYRCIDTLIHFKGLPYRQEIVGEKDGITFFNDTTSTTPVASEVAIETFKKNSIVLILGGNSKGIPYKDLIDRLSIVKKIVLLRGTFTDEIYPILKKKYPEKITEQFNNLEKSVYIAYQEAMKLLTTNYQLPTIILFSPGATSFAMFNNEFHRGDEFNRIVNKLLISNYTTRK